MAACAWYRDLSAGNKMSPLVPCREEFARLTAGSNERHDRKASKPATSLMAAPDTTVDVRETFGVDIDWQVPAFSKADDRVPDLDESYVFDPDTTLAILAGFAHDRRVMVQGYHGTGKSTHIEQVAARLNWPCIRINWMRISPYRPDQARCHRSARRFAGDGISRRPAAVGTAASRRPGVRRIRAGRPDVMFVIQRVLEQQGKLTARPEPRDPPRSELPDVCDLEHGRPGRYQRAVSRHAADQRGPDGPLEHRGRAELPARRGGAGHRRLEIRRRSQAAG